VRADLNTVLHVRGLAAGLGLALLAAAAARAEPTLAGTVTLRDGSPLAGVQVLLELRSRKPAARTDAQGRFAFDAATLFPAAELNAAPALTLVFTLPAHHEQVRVLRRVPGRAPAPVQVQLSPTGGAAALSAAERELLDRHVATPGSLPLYLVPYRLGGVTGADPQRVNQALRANLERVIVSHVQAAAPGRSTPVSLKLLPLAADADSADIDRLRTYGTHLKALGMISGFGEVEATGGGERQLDVSSTFLVVPRAQDLAAPVLYVDDSMPADRVASPLLYRHLSKLWGRSTVLALALADFAQAKERADKPALQRIRDTLQAERADAGPGNELLLAQLEDLIVRVDAELAR